MNLYADVHLSLNFYFDHGPIIHFGLSVVGMSPSPWHLSNDILLNQMIQCLYLFYESAMELHVAPISSLDLSYVLGSIKVKYAICIQFLCQFVGCLRITIYLELESWIKIYIQRLCWFILFFHRLCKVYERLCWFIYLFPFFFSKLILLLRTMLILN
jgi:hypothetical protein